MASITLPPVMNILRPHPIGSKPNLQKICQDANITYENTETRSQLTDKIVNFSNESLTNEALVRSVVNEISAESKAAKTKGVSTTSESDSETMELDSTQTQVPTTESSQNSQTPLFNDSQESNEVAELASATKTTDPPTESTAPNLKKRLLNPEDENDEIASKKSKTDDTIVSLLQSMISNMNAEHMETRKLMSQMVDRLDNLEKTFSQFSGEFHQSNLNMTTICNEVRNQNCQVSEVMQKIETGVHTVNEKLSVTRPPNVALPPKNASPPNVTSNVTSPTYTPSPPNVPSPSTSLPKVPSPRNTDNNNKTTNSFVRRS